MAANTSESFVFVLNAAFETQKRKNEKVSQQGGSLESFQSQCLCSEQWPQNGKCWVLLAGANHAGSEELPCQVQLFIYGCFSVECISC